MRGTWLFHQSSLESLIFDVCHSFREEKVRCCKGSGGVLAATSFAPKSAKSCSLTPSCPGIHCILASLSNT